MEHLPLMQFTEQDLAKARTRGKLVGWIQGGGAVLAAAFVWNLLGWIPTLAVLGGVIYVLYKLMSRSRKSDAVGGEGGA